MFRITGKIHDYRLDLSAANSQARDINELHLGKNVHTNTNRTEYDKADSLCIQILKQRARPWSSGQLEPNFDDGAMRICKDKNELLSEQKVFNFDLD